MNLKLVHLIFAFLFITVAIKAAAPPGVEDLPHGNEDREERRKIHESNLSLKAQNMIDKKTAIKTKIEPTEVPTDEVVKTVTTVSSKTTESVSTTTSVSSSATLTSTSSSSFVSVTFLPTTTTTDVPVETQFIESAASKLTFSLLVLSTFSLYFLL